MLIFIQEKISKISSVFIYQGISIEKLVNFSQIFSIKITFKYCLYSSNIYPILKSNVINFLNFCFFCIKVLAMFFISLYDKLIKVISIKLLQGKFSKGKIRVIFGISNKSLVNLIFLKLNGLFLRNVSKCI